MTYEVGGREFVVVASGTGYLQILMLTGNYAEFPGLSALLVHDLFFVRFNLVSAA